MSESLDEILRNEIAIWKLVYPFEVLEGGSVLFYYDEYPTHPHWNVVYPSEHGIVNETDLLKARRFFSDRQRKGFYYSSERKSNKQIVSSDEFFIHTNRFNYNGKTANLFRVEELYNTVTFSDLVSECFQLQGSGKSQFALKMNMVKKNTDAHFFAFYSKTEIIGCWSTFQSSKKFNFLMNFGILPKFQGQGFSKEMAIQAQINSDRTLITHSNSEILRTCVLPKLGFKSMGKLFIYEI